MEELWLKVLYFKFGFRYFKGLLYLKIILSSILKPQLLYQQSSLMEVEGMGYVLMGTGTFPYTVNNQSLNRKCLKAVAT